MPDWTNNACSYLGVCITMNKGLTSFVAVILCAASTACTHAVWVTKSIDNGKTKGADGVPFYVKNQVFARKTTYDKTWLRATLTVERELVDLKTGKAAPYGTGKEAYVRDVAKPGPAILDQIKARIIAADTGSVEEAEQVIRQFSTITTLPDDTAIAPVLIGNTVESQWVVNNQLTYYLNGPLPWFGSGNVSQELNGDGTLSKASSNPESKLAEGVSTLLPLKEFLSGKFVKSGATAVANTATAAVTMESLDSLRNIRSETKPADTQVIYSLALEIQEVGHEYTLNSDQIADRTNVPNRLTFADIDANTAMFVRKDIPNAGSDSKKTDGREISLKGTITLPKDSITTPAKDDAAVPKKSGSK